MTKEDLTSIVKSAIDEAVKPLNDRINTLEQADAENPTQTTTEPVTKEAEKTDDDIVNIIKSAISAAVEPITKRLDVVEKSRGIQKSQSDVNDVNKGNEEDECYLHGIL